MLNKKNGTVMWISPSQSCIQISVNMVGEGRMNDIVLFVVVDEEGRILCAKNGCSKVLHRPNNYPSGAMRVKSR